MSNIHYIILCAAAILLYSCSDKKNGEITVKRVRVQTVSCADGAKEVLYPGKVKAAQDVNLAFRVSGTIDRYLVEEGTYVRKGQALVQLDDTDYKVQLDATEAEYAAVKAEAERVIAMYNDSVATPNDYDKATNGLKQITAKLQHHKDELAYTCLYSPFDGYVQKHLFDGAETVMSGIPVISLISGSQPEVEINIPASEYVNRASFTTYTCTFSMYPDEVYDLSLISISPKANANQLYTMRLQIKPSEKAMPTPGMNTMVTIVKSEGTTVSDDELCAMQVPTSAVLSKEGRSSVFIYDENSQTVKQTDVTVLSLSSNGTCTIEGDVPSGSKIVTSGVRFLDNGDKVELIGETSASNVGNLL